MVKDVKYLILKNLEEGIILQKQGLYINAFEKYINSYYYALNIEHPAVILMDILKHMNSIVEYINENKILNQYSKAIDDFEKLVQYTPVYDQHLASILSTYSFYLYKNSKLDKSKYNYEKVNILYRKLYKQYPKSRYIKSNTVLNLINTGQLLIKMHLFDEALWKFEKALLILDDKEKLLENCTLNLDQKTLIMKYMCGLYKELNQFKKVKEIYLQIIKIHSISLHENYLPFYYKERVIKIINLGKELLYSKSTDRLFETFERKTDVYQNLILEYPDNKEIILNYTIILGSIAYLLNLINKSKDALNIYNEAFTVFNNLKHENIEKEEINCLIYLLFNFSELLIFENKVDEGLDNLLMATNILSNLDSNKPNKNSSDIIFKYFTNIFNHLISINYEINDKLLDICNNLSNILSNEQLMIFKKLLNQNFESVKLSKSVLDSNIVENIDNTPVKLADISFKKGLYKEAFDGYINLYNNSSEKELLIKAHKILERVKIDLKLNKDAHNIENMYFLLYGYEILEKNDTLNSNYHYNLAIINKELANELIEVNKLDKAKDKFEDSINEYFLYISLCEKYRIKEVLDILENFRLILTKIKCQETQLEINKKITESYGLLYKLDSTNKFLLEKLAYSQNLTASLFSEINKNDEACENLIQSLYNYVNLYQIEPSAQYAQKIALLMNNIGTILTRTGQEKKAKKFLESALNVYSFLLDDKPNDIKVMALSACTLDNLGTLFIAMDRFEDSKHMYESALKIYLDMNNLIQDDISYSEQISQTIDNLGYLLNKMGRNTDAHWMHTNAKKIKNKKN